MTRSRKALLTACAVVIVACGFFGAWLEITYGDPS